MSSGYGYYQDSNGNPQIPSTNFPYPVQSMNKNQSKADSSWTIPSGAAESTSSINLDGKLLAALAIPSSYTGGNITFKSALTSSGTYNDVYDSNGSLVTINVGGSDRVVSITGTPLQALASLQFIKVKTTTNVGANTTIGLITKG